MNVRTLLFAACLLWAGGLLLIQEVRVFPEFREGWAAFREPIVTCAAGEAVIVWGRRLEGLLVLAAAQLGCLAVGRRAVRWAGRRSAPGLLSLPLGWGLAGLLQAGLGLTGLASPPCAAAAGLLPAVLWRRPGRAPRTWSRRPTRRRGPPSGLAVGVLGVLVLPLLASLAPETANDPLTHHLANPLRALALHRLVEWPFTVHDDLPWLWESLAQPLLAAGGEAAVRWLNPLLLVTTAISVYELGRSALGAEAASWAAALLLTNPFLVRQALVAKNDLLAMALAFTALRWALLAAPRGGFSAAGVLFGATAAFAFTAKFPAAFAVAGVGVVLIASVPGVWLPAAAGALLALPLLLRNELCTGDPVFPFAAGAMGSPFVSPAGLARLRTHLSIVTLQDPSAISWWLPLQRAFGAMGGEEHLVRLLAVLPAVVLVRPPWPRAARASLAMLGTGLAGWAAGPAQIRYAVTVFPAAAFLAVFALASAGGRGSRPSGRRVLTAAIALQVLHAAWSPEVCVRLRAGLGVENSASYVTRRLTALAEAADRTRRDAGPRGRVLLLGDDRTVPVSPVADAGAFGETTFVPYALVRASRTPDDLWHRWRQRPWTHVLYNRLSAFFWRRNLGDDPWTSRDLDVWAGFWRDHAEQVWESSTMDLAHGYFYLFRIVSRPRRRPATALPGMEGWTSRMEQLLAAGRTEEAERDRVALRRAAGDFGAVDAIEAQMFRAESRERRWRLLERAVSRGWRSPAVYAQLAAFAAVAGRAQEAVGWRQRALALDPSLTAASLAGLEREAMAR